MQNSFRLRAPTKALVRLRLRGGSVVRCRPGTTDAQVFYDTFVAQYHLPPLGFHPSSILDLGSNIGTTIIHYAGLYPRARILGVELDEGNFLLAQRNIASLGDRCTVLHGAAWWEDGEVTYGGDQEWGRRVQANGIRKAQAYSIPKLLDQLGPTVDFVKMDIEGAEAEILARGQT